MEELIRATLLGTAPIATLVADRVDWEESPQGSDDARIALHLISNVPSLRMGGLGNWRDARVQADCWGPTHKTARDLGLALETRMQGFRTVSDGKKFRVFVIDAANRPDTSGTTTLHRRQVDLRIHYQA